jgi:hypothetical protein
MPVIPLGAAAYNRDASFLPEVELINLYVEDDASGASVDEKLRLQRPGLVHFGNVAGAVRGMFQSDGVAGSRTFLVAADKLQTITNTATSTLGTVSNDGTQAHFAAAFDKLAVASGGNLYLLDDEDALMPLLLPDQDTDSVNRRAIDITALNNYIVIACPDGRFFWLPPGVSDFNDLNALNFATAESAADGLVACHALMDEVYLFGPSTVEVWQTTGSADLPFQRAPGRNFTRGCLHADTVATVDNTLFFVGSNGVVYRASTVPQRVSTYAIEEHLAKRTGNPSAFVYTLDAHEFYCLTIPGRGTFAYDAATKGWSRLKSIGMTEFRARHAVSTADGTLLGDAATGTVWRFDRAAAMDGNDPIERIVTGTAPLPSRRSTRNDSIALYVGSSATCSYRLRWHEGQGSYPSTYRMLGARAGDDVLTSYRLGHGRESYRTFEISCVDPAIIRISGMIANEAFD